MRRTRVVEPLLSAALALVALGAALVSQHRFDMQPCPWCVLQRLLFAVVAALALLEATTLTLAGGRGDGDAWQSGDLNGQWPLAAPLLAGLRGLLAVCGLAAALWQHLVAAASASCNLTLADRVLAITRLDGLWPDVFQPRASCLEAKAFLLGVPYEFWSGALFILLAALAARSALKTHRGT